MLKHTKLHVSLLAINSCSVGVPNIYRIVDKLAKSVPDLGPLDLGNLPYPWPTWPDIHVNQYWFLVPADKAPHSPYST